MPRCHRRTRRLSSRVGALTIALSGLAGLAAPVTAQDVQEAVAVAVRIEARPVIDGVLDEAFWRTIDPITDFLQRDPVDGAPPTERTEVRIAYTEEALYFGMMMYDSEPELILGNILQRGGWIDKDDRVMIALDTYQDRRNAYLFEIGSLGAQDDALISDESGQDWNWDGIYTTEARITDEGWVLEVEIPFTTIRFDDPTAPEMGIVLYRNIRRKNEHAFWPHIGQEYRGGITQVSQYARLTGLQDLRKGRHIEVKPFAITGATRPAGGPTDTEVDAGLDVKAALSSNLALDLTYNTDFAQVEADNVEINLTRFDLFFPEKREFFLERAALFQFGAQRETEVFFSRRVGLDGDIVGGGRLTGEVGPFSVGALSLATERIDPMAPPNEVTEWSSVARLQGNLRPRTTVGGIATSKDGGGEHNR
ncbi:MAG: carbohydrate binding family 9 domain-containing protein, partial [Gemmatimonadetes bacterium]|nr:carbohydrate binding family 9 domain-containing protein [Gemmatimonadota bacterium]